MSLFDSASLVVTPSGYKEDKLYSIKPTDGSGDLVVTRATTATRVNSAGLIEVVPRNLLQYSEAISTSPWALVRSTVSTNSINSPTGTLTADTLVSNITGPNGSWTSQIVSAINGNFNMSIYAKQGTSPFLQVSLDGLGAVIFNLSNGTVKLSSSGIIGSITSVGSDGWYRCSISGTATGQTTALFIVGNSSMNLVTWFATNGDSVYLWGAQVEQGSLTEYFPTTDRLDVPRLDYTNSTCPSILVEPQRTNLLLRSEEFDNASWSKTFSSISANATTSPNGTLIADKLIEDTANNQHRIDQTTTSVIGTNTFSVFAKKSERDSVWLRIGGSGSYFDLTNGTISGTVGVTASIENYGNGWYKCIIVRTSTVANEIARINLAIGINATYLGNGTSGLFIWGAQLEAGSNATSYIPTVASSVTRNADVISKTGISSLIGQTEGTIFVDANLSVNANERRLLTISNETETQRLFVCTLGTLLYTSFNNISVNLGNFPIGTTKIAIGYTISGGNTTYSIKVNNNALVTGTAAAAAPNPLSAINLGSNATSGLQLNDRINSTLIWKERLSNTELAQLTTI